MEKLFQGLNKHRIWGYEIFSVPLYLFLFLAIMVFAANQMDVIPGSMVGSIGAMFVIGIIMGEIGDRLPIWKDYIGGGTLLALLGGSLLVYFNLFKTINDGFYRSVDEIHRLYYLLRSGSDYWKYFINRQKSPD